MMHPKFTLENINDSVEILTSLPINGAIEVEPHNSPIKGVFFDLDDVLINTTKNTKLAQREALSRIVDTLFEYKDQNIQLSRVVEEYFTDVDDPMEGLQFVLDFVVKRLGSNSRSHFNEILKYLDISTMNPFYNDIIISGIEGYHETRDFAYSRDEALLYTLSEIQENVSGNIAIISTNVNYENIQKKLELSGLNDFFNEDNVSVVSEEDALEKGVGKYHAILKMAKEFEIDPENILYADDRVCYITQANMANVQTAYWLNIDGKYCKGPRRELITDQADMPNYIVGNINGLSEIIEEKK